MKPNLTHHASQRLKERMGIKSRAEKERIASLALQRGKPVKIEENDTSHRTIMTLEYQDRLFVFGRSGSLITVLPPQKKCYGQKRGLLEVALIKESKRQIMSA